MAKAVKKAATDAVAVEAAEAMKNMTKQEKFEAAIAAANKKFGDGAVQMITDELISEEQKLEEVNSTGILQVDRATTRGGFVKGTMVEIYGPESSGKTTLCLHTIAECLKAGGSAVYVDAEHALQKDHVNNCGINKLHIVQPSSGEEGLNVVEHFVRAGTDIIVVDSVAALVPQDELDGEMGKQFMGLQARMMSQALRKLTGIVSKSRSNVLWINQIRHKIGVMFGSPETTPGGNSLKFYASLRLDMRRREQIKVGETVVANTIHIKAVKNKTGAPYGEADFTMFFNARKTIISNAVEFGSQVGIVEKSGTWYAYKGERLGQGLTNAVAFLDDKPAIVDEILQQCRINLFKPVVKLDNII